LLYKLVFLYLRGQPSPQDKEQEMYGLNDKNSPNYIADFAERVRTMAELQLQAQENSMTISELIAYYNGDK
jgi:hypothetical protein